MKMKWKMGILIGVLIVGTILLSVVEEAWNPQEKPFTIAREQQHIKDMEEGANPQIGLTKIPDDSIVQKNFESHLPLVVIDVGDASIPITKDFKQLSDDGEAEIIHTGVEPYVYGSISVIDNANHVNSLEQEPTLMSEMKIRYRGNSSIEYEKKQYAIKLLNADGSNRKMSMLSMTENNDWVLNGSMLDASLMRNYMAYNIGSSVFPYTTEAKYCEVLLKKGETYTYQGLYLMMEQVEKGQDRVEIRAYQPGDDVVSYLLCRDRLDKQEVQLSTYGSENDLCYGRLSILYPKADVLDEYAVEYIENDIDAIERVLYSDDKGIFSTWSDYLDKQSFVDYFLINEMFGNYDAGNNSTYLYRDGVGKVCIGPLWDYDGAMDNYPLALNNPQQVLFKNQAWFDRLCMSQEYVNRLQTRYKQMKNTIFSADELGTYIDSVSQFLGNAAKREWSRWENVYGENSTFTSQEDQDGYMVNRKRTTYEEELQRLKDFFTIKELHLEDGLKELEKGVVDMQTHRGSYAVVILVLSLICSVVLIRRRNTFK